VRIAFFGYVPAISDIAYVAYAALYLVALTYMFEE
jgi:hypothetical protein